MWTENLPIQKGWIVFVNLCYVGFNVVFSLLDDSKIHDCSWQCTSFDQDSFAIRHSRQTDAAISDFLYFDTLDQFRHRQLQELKAKLRSEISLDIFYSIVSVDSYDFS